jgi:glycosyltransferase involved in cell wall biosynthesis
MTRLSIVIPAYNEEKRINNTLNDYLAFYNNKETEIIVVLNGCSDNTEKVVKEYQQKFPEILKYLNIKESIGKGGAVHEGFLQAKGELIGFVDADKATEAKEFNKLAVNIKEADGIVASRWLKNSVIKNRTWLRKMASKVFALLVKAIFRMPFTDTQCGAKLFKRDPLLTILPKLHEKGMAFDVELLYAFYTAGYKVKEADTVWEDKPGSATLGSPLRVFSKGLTMLKKLFKIKKYGAKSNF